MAPIPPVKGTPAAHDDLDDLFNYDVAMDDVFRDPSAGQEEVAPNSTTQRNAANDDAELGIDEEIKITRKRQPIAKLDTDRLLSSSGIPKLRRISKDRLRLRGKGHEFRDMARLLNMYQFWLDDLYPRANFTDGLSIIEKLGHTKRMQVMRRQWIDEGKPKPSVEETLEAQPAEDREHSTDDAPAPESVPRDGSAQATLSDPEPPSNQADVSCARAAGHTTNNTAGNTAGEPEEDELDALLADDAVQNEREESSLFGSGTVKANQPNKQDFEDEMEAMAELDDGLFVMEL